MKVTVFVPEESHRKDLEELLFQLSGKKRVLGLHSFPGTYCLGAFDGEKLVGFAQLFVLHKTTFTMGHLEDVIVHSDYRKRGIGRQLMEEVISLAKREGCAVINLTTRSEREDAWGLYESLGFEQPCNTVFRLTLT